MGPSVPWNPSLMTVTGVPAATTPGIPGATVFVAGACGAPPRPRPRCADNGATASTHTRTAVSLRNFTARLLGNTSSTLEIVRRAHLENTRQDDARRNEIRRARPQIPARHEVRVEHVEEVEPAFQRVAPSETDALRKAEVDQVRVRQSNGSKRIDVEDDRSGSWCRR